MAKKKENARDISHAGVLPYRVNGHGLELLLITTRRSKRWSVPKGHCRGEADARRTAATEAFEEAGLEGTVAKHPIGTFSHAKSGPALSAEAIVLLFPMRVARQLESWPEKGQRRLMWAGPRKAAKLVDPELSALIKRFSEGHSRRRASAAKRAQAKR
jgi:8-oxo-dGTP pyrophosphatase MutT (NUDIX family)